MLVMPDVNNPEPDRVLATLNEVLARQAQESLVLLLSKQLVVLRLLRQELGLEVVGLCALLHLTQLVGQGLASLVRLRPFLARFAALLALRYQVLEH